MRLTTRGVRGCFGVMVLFAGAPVWADVIDTVGDQSSSAGPNPWNGKGNAFRADIGTVLLEQEFYLDFTGPRSISFYVYHSPVEFGAYALIQSNTVFFDGTGAAWYSSGAVNVALLASQYYVLAFSMPGDMIYYFGTGASQAVSFGEQVHGFATGTHPLGPTIDSLVDDSAIYHQRIRTLPEPATLLAALAVLTMPRRR